MRRRLLLSYLTVSVFVLLVLEVPLAVFFADRERERLLTAVERDATVLATYYEDALQLGEPYGPRPALDYAASTGFRVVVVDGSGRSILDTGRPANRDFSTRPEVVTALAGSRAIGVRASETLGADLLYVAVPVASGGEVFGAVRVTFPPGEAEQRIHRFWLGLVAVGLVVLAAMTGVGWVVAGSIARPVRQVEEAAARVAAGDLDVRLEAGDAPRDLRDLVTTFNDMAARLRHVLERQQAFVGDASHELRTPLTALRLRLENLEATAEGEARRDLEGAIAETNRLAGVVDQLLAIATAEAARTRPEPVDLPAVVRDRAAAWEPVATEQAAAVDVRLPAGAARGVAVRGGVEQILDNFLSNALAVTPAGGRVTVEVIAAGAGWELHVRDLGPGMTAEERARAFERFWRGDPDRPGTGLGLAIVRRLAELSGGRAELRAGEGGGTDAVLWLPAG